MAWVLSDVDAREASLPDLMEFVRLPLLSQDYLVQRVGEEPLITKNTLCMYMISSVFSMDERHVLRRFVCAV